MKPSLLFPLLTLAAMISSDAGAEPPSTNAPPEWLTRPLSLAAAVDTALQQNRGLLQVRSEVEAAHGLRIQTRAVALPRFRAFGSYQWSDQLEELSLPSGQTLSFQRENQWAAGFQLLQSIYEGGRVRASLRSGRLVQRQALLQYEGAVNDTVLQVRTAYYDVLLAAQRIAVQKESLQLLQEELTNTVRRFDAGTVPKFNVLRAEVEVANARPGWIQAGNSYRIAKTQLASLLGYRLPAEVWTDIPLELTDKLEVHPQAVGLSESLTQALNQRPELAVLRLTERLRDEEIRSARAGYLPSVQVFAGHGWRSATFAEDLATGIDGWNAGAQVSWNLFDGLATAGKVQEARARRRGAEHAREDALRRVELEVRTAHSSLVEAEEVLNSQLKVQEQAEEALRLAQARSDAGAGIQLDVLSARTALTQARTTEIQARRDYLAARARLDHAIGLRVGTATLEGPVYLRNMPGGAPPMRAISF